MSTGPSSNERVQDLEVSQANKKQSAFLADDTFRKIRRKLRRVLVWRDPPQEIFDACCRAAIAKCIEFNIAASVKPRRGHLSYMLPGLLRGICEDFITLCFLQTLAPRNRDEFVAAVLQRNIYNGITAQRSFFEANNPLQPILGQALAQDELTHQIDDATEKIRKSVGRPKTPTVWDMAQTVGLISTYRFIYFASSNFVHFNPHCLLRTGWTTEKAMKNFEFKLANMEAYYVALASFYGTVLFIGFHSAFPDIFSGRFSIKKYTNDLEKHLSSYMRWPEIVTFEEMNLKPPAYWLPHTIREALRKTDPHLSYGKILDEVKGAGRTNIVA